MLFFRVFRGDAYTVHGHLFLVSRDIGLSDAISLLKRLDDSSDNVWKAKDSTANHKGAAAIVQYSTA